MPPPHLLPGEAVDLAAPVRAESFASSPEEIARKYISGDIRIVTEQARTQLPEITGILKAGRYKLQPEYQRRRRWSTEKQSRLIESFLMNVPVPPIFLYEFEYANYEVMDGLQRLSTIADFYRDELRLDSLEYWRELEGLTYSELPAQLRHGIDRRYLSSIVLLYETARDEAQAQRLKELVFDRINSGGVSLSTQEKRNALSYGPLNVELPRLARTPAFCRAWGIPEPDEDELRSGTIRPEVLDDARYQSMEDVEMVLRFFAHRQRTAPGAPRNMRYFLDRYWITANAEYPMELVQGIGQLFVDTIELAVRVLGESAFYIRRERDYLRVWVPRPTLLAYDSIMSAFSQHLVDADRLIEKAEDVRLALQNLYDEHATNFDGRRTDPSDVATRDDLISGMLSSIAAR